MKPYKPINHIHLMGLLILTIGSIVLGLAIGALAYAISNLVYFIVGFALGIGIITMFAYYRLVHLSKIRQSIISSLYGIVIGLSVAIGFYGTPYLTFRNKIIAGYQEKYHITAQAASIGFDQTIKDVTGSSGFLGYMKLRASSGDVYTQYLIVNSLPVQEFSFSLKDTGSWINWTIETLLFIIPSTFIGYLIGKTAFSISANEWYDGPSSQIGSVRIEDKEKLHTCLSANDLMSLCDIILPEGQIKHPQIEVYKQSTKSKKSNILLSFKQTLRVSEKRVRRVVVSQWEVQPVEMESIMNMLRERFANLHPDAALV